MTTRDSVRAGRECANWATVRSLAAAWGSTSIGRDLTWLLNVLDGKLPLSESRVTDILVSGHYFKTTAGDGSGDDVLALVDAVREKAQ